VAAACKEFFAMCDYSLHSVRTRPAKIGDKLVTRGFGTGTRGFASVADLNIAVCLLPGTELAFAGEVTFRSSPKRQQSHQLAAPIWAAFRPFAHRFGKNADADLP